MRAPARSRESSAGLPIPKAPDSITSSAVLSEARSWLETLTLSDNGIERTRDAQRGLAALAMAAEFTNWFSSRA